MYNIPGSYKKESVINKENFIPKEETARNKKRIREDLKRVRLKYQIDKGLSNLISEKYNVQVIMVLEIEISSMKNIEFLNEIFQNLLKGYAVIKFKTGDKIAFGYGYKRLNKLHSDEIILEDSFTTDIFEEVFFHDEYKLYKNYLDFDNIKNKNNKLEFYIENMVKAYLISNRDNFKRFKDILESNIYYSLGSTFKLFHVLKDIVDTNKKLKKTNITSEKIGLNKKLVGLNMDLGGLLDG